MPVRGVNFWKHLYPLLWGLQRRSGVSFNRLVNLACQKYLGECGFEGLQVWVEIDRLCGGGAFEACLSHDVEVG